MSRVIATISLISFLCVRVEAQTDTSRLPLRLTRYDLLLDLTKGKLIHKIDSLKRLNLPTDGYNKLLDSIKHGSPLKDAKLAEAKLASLERKVNLPVAKFMSGANNFEKKVKCALLLHLLTFCGLLSWPN